MIQLLDAVLHNGLRIWAARRVRSTLVSCARSVFASLQPNWSAP